MLVQLLRLFIGSKGNKTETSATTGLFIMTTLITVGANIYFLKFQTYVLVIDTVINAISLISSAFEFVFAAFAAIEFKSLENSR